ncbi:MAG: ATP synthase subunit I [Nannocystaceae bacterium]
MSQNLPSWDRWKRLVYLWTLTWCAPAAVAAIWLWRPTQALSIVLGGLLGLFNLQLLASAAFKMLEQSAEELRQQAATSSRVAPLQALLRWPVTALATAAILWYMPGEPEGLATGVGLALVGFVSAGVQTASDLANHSEHEDPPEPYG